MEGVEDNEMKQRLQELQKQLGKKQLFEEAVSKISSLLTLYYASASPSLSNLFYTVVCRVATILKARYTAKGFWTSGLHLFLEAEKLVAEPSQKDHLRICIGQAKEHLSELENQSEGVEKVQNRTGGGYSCEGHFTVDPEPPQPEWLMQSNLSTPVANLVPLHNGGGGSGDMLLQWGHRKRSRISRSVENRSAGAATGGNGMADDSSSSSSTQLQAMMKVPRRSITLPTPARTTAGLIETKNSSNSNIMPPPSSVLPDKISITASAPANSSTSNGKVGSYKSSSKDNSFFVNRRNLEDRSGGGSGSHPPRSSSGKGVIAAASSSRSKLLKRSPQKVVEKIDQKKIGSTCATTVVCSSGSASLKIDEKVNGLVHQEQVVGIGMNHHQNNIGSDLPQEAGCSNTTATNHNHEDISSTKIIAGGVAVEAMNGGGEVHEWPRVHIPLTRKEKEEDFLLMKGTKLPHRPKKRPKAVDRMLQYCFPGTWLADVTKARYEVKEKKCTTKKPKRRGLKGMESMESDSE